MDPQSTMLLVLFLCSTTTHFSAGMIIYKDVISGDEMFLSDIYKVKVAEDDVFYEVEGKVVTRTEGIDVDKLLGGDATAAEMIEFAESSVSGVDIILNHHLQEIQFTKRQYEEHLKGYTKKVKEHLEQEQPDRVAVFMAAAGPAFKYIVQHFKDWQFFTGETKNREGMVALLNYREDGVTPYMLFTKDGLKEERA